MAALDQEILLAIHGLQKSGNFITEAMESCLDLATEFNDLEALDGVKRVKQCLKTFISLEQDIAAYKTATESVGKELEKPEVGGAVEEVFRQRYTTAKQGAPLVEKHEKYKELHERLASGDSDVEAAEASQAECVEGEMSISVEQTTKCPYTGQDMVKPVKNVNCGHSYDLAGIKQYIELCKQKKKKAKCPVGACGNTSAVTLECLEDNKQLKQLIDSKKRAEARSKRRK